MSGGSINNIFSILMVAEDIKETIENDGYYIDTDWSAEANFYGIRPKVECDRFCCKDKEKRELIIKEAKNLVVHLNNCYERARALDYLISGDYGEDSYLERLKEIQNENNS